MKVQYASDLHLEFSNNRSFIRENHLTPIGDILILNGDIINFAHIDKFNDFFNYISDNFKMTYWVPGNHEYYSFNINEKSGYVFEKIRDNIILVNDVSIVIEDVKFIFSTLWSKININNKFIIERKLSDFKYIKFDNKLLTVEEFNLLHDNSFNFINNEIKKQFDGRVSIFTHHKPTFLNQPDFYKGDVLNDAFCVELFEFINDSNIYCWCYGHTHYNSDDFMIGNTKLITNQLGYIDYGENNKFYNNKIIEI